MQWPVLGLTHVIAWLSQHLSRPTNVHLNLSKFVLKIHEKNSWLCLNFFFKSQSNLNLIGYCDSNSANAEDRSISGYYQLDKNGSLI